LFLLSRCGVFRILQFRSKVAQASCFGLKQAVLIFESIDDGLSPSLIARRLSGDLCD